MTLGSISTQYLGTALLPAMTQAQNQLTKLEIEASTGQYADLGLQLADQSGYELSLRNQTDLLQSRTAANGIVNTNMGAAQAALSSILSSAQTAAQNVATWRSGTNAAAELQTLGQSSLQQLISAANTNAGGQYVFGGINSGQAPINDYYTPSSSAKNAFDQAFQSTFGFASTDPAATAITPAQIQGFLTGAFAALFGGANWTSDWSSASSTNTSAEIAPGQNIETSTNANAAGFQQLAQGFAMLSEFGGARLSRSALQEVATQALGAIGAGVSSITWTQAQIGAAQSQITQANASMNSQIAILQTRIGDLDNINPSEVATRLNTLTTQIETAYHLTAQLQKMSLAQYLPA